MVHFKEKIRTWEGLVSLLHIQLCYFITFGIVYFLIQSLNTSNAIHQPLNYFSHRTWTDFFCCTPFVHVLLATQCLTTARSALFVDGHEGMDTQYYAQNKYKDGQLLLQHIFEKSQHHLHFFQVQPVTSGTLIRPFVMVLFLSLSTLLTISFSLLPMELSFFAVIKTTFSSISMLLSSLFTFFVSILYLDSSLDCSNGPYGSKPLSRRLL